MNLSNKTIEILCDFINEKTKHRSGANLVLFFNQLGFNDVYDRGFPSRKTYTLEKLHQINNTKKIDECITNLFAPIEFVPDIRNLDCLIKEFNQYLVFDGWKVSRKNKEIVLKSETNIDICNSTTEEIVDEKRALKQYYPIELSSLSLSHQLEKILENRKEEIYSALENQMPLTAIILSGSFLEGILFDLAVKNPESFNQANSCPKDQKTKKTKQFKDWTLTNYIDVAYELGYLKEDVKKFSHILREFRNYIHPYEQMNKNFKPTIQTAQLCLQTLTTAISQISANIK